MIVVNVLFCNIGNIFETDFLKLNLVKNDNR